MIIITLKFQTKNIMACQGLEYRFALCGIGIVYMDMNVQIVTIFSRAIITELCNQFQYFKQYIH